MASIVGRYYAMDRDNRWNRIEQAYRMLTEAHAPFSASTSAEALQQAYKRGEDDELVQATLIAGARQALVKIEDGDAVLFMNFRADRARQLSRAFLDPGFHSFQRRVVPKLADFVMTTEYAADIAASCAIPPATLENVLPDYLS